MIPIVVIIVFLLFLYYIHEKDWNLAIVSVIIAILLAILGPLIENAFFREHSPETSTESIINTHVESGTNNGEGSETDANIDSGTKTGEETGPDIIVEPESGRTAPDSLYLGKDLEPFDKTNGIYIHRDFDDIRGNKYYHGIIGYLDQSYGEAYQSYKLDWKYDKLSFTATAYRKSYQKPNEDYKASIYIYADERMIYRNENIDLNSIPETVELDIRNCDILRIELYGAGNTYTTSDGVSACMAEPKITLQN